MRAPGLAEETSRGMQPETSDMVLGLFKEVATQRLEVGCPSPPF